MIVANTNIVVGMRTFQKGQAVTGLSALDRRWMQAAGYISDMPDTSGEQKGRKAQKPEPDILPAVETGEGG